jgi:predicted ATPase
VPHLVSLSLKPSLDPSVATDHPFTVPAIRTLATLDLRVGVTFFVGENGSGKSTLLEGIAAAAELATLGSSEVAFDDTLVPARRLAAALRLAWAPRSRQGFFLRAEDFFGYPKAQARIDARFGREKTEKPGEPVVSPNGSSHPDELLAGMLVGHYDSRSHGESFMDVFTTRVRPRGLYLLDEPEAPLSPRKQIELVKLMASAAANGAQFVVATHSPILLACPGARIFSFDQTPIAEIAYDEIDHVAVTRSFLNDPRRFLDGR